MDKDKTKDKNKSKSSSIIKQYSFQVVGIGSSAGGLEALSELLTNLRSDTGMAFVLISHMNPVHDSITSSILSKKTNMPVVEIENKMVLKPNMVYIIPPNADVILVNGAFTLIPRKISSGLHLPIDSFFKSLAEDRKNQSIGVILSGTASDGAAGIAYIKAAGGYVFAQDPSSAKFDGMPQNAIASGIVDLILTPKKIAEELSRLTKYPVLFPTDEKSNSANSEEVYNNDLYYLTQILTMLGNHYNADFTQYKQNTLKRRIIRRMMLQKQDNLCSYIDYLQNNPAELELLYSDILINVTQFFRNREAFVELKKTILPEILKQKESNTPFRIWIVGCSTGEEVYSVAISLLEYLEEANQKMSIQIRATDISETSINKARTGIYPENISQNLSPERLQRFFIKVDNGYKINNFLREICLFSKHDVTRDPPFAKLDLICCRNLLIYFSSLLQKRVLSIFHYSLNPKGILWLGASETVGELSSHFLLNNKTNRFYTKKQFSQPIKMLFPAYNLPGKVPATIKQETAMTTVSSRIELQREAERISLSCFAPPSVVVNQDMEIILASGNTSLFLQLPSGHASLNILKMARPELVVDLRMMLQAAKTRDQMISKEQLSLNEDGQITVFNLYVTPISSPTAIKEKYFLIHFVNSTPATKKSAKSEQLTRKNMMISAKDKYLNELENSLKDLKAYQVSIVSDLESSRDELSAGNEELQSINEELQSTNEELETAKEELQSANEELTTVNDELQNRNLDLAQLNNDLNNLLSCVDIPIIMVDLNGYIRRFTPKASKIMDLISNDIGRPIGNIKPNFDNIDLQQLVTGVIETATPNEVEVRDSQNHWYRLQIRPYKTQHHNNEGAIIALVDIDALKQNINEKELALDHATSVANTIQLPLIVLDENAQWQSGNSAFFNTYHELAELAKRDFIKAFSTVRGESFELKSMLFEVLTGDAKSRQLELVGDFVKIGFRALFINMRKIQWLGDGPEAVLLSIEDITERRELQKSIIQSEQKFHALVEYINEVIITTNQHNIIEFVNCQIEKYFGYLPEDLVGKPFSMLIPQKFHANINKFQRKMLTFPNDQNLNPKLCTIGKRKDETEFPIDIYFKPSKNSLDNSMTLIIHDISDSKEIELQRDELLVREQSARIAAERANSIKDAFLATLSHELRTPLTSILSWAQLIQQADTDASRLKQGIAMIERSAKTLGQLIDELLDIARIQSGKLSLHITEIDPEEPLRAATDSLRLMAEEKLITINTWVAPNQGKVFADASRLQQAIWNLLTNAIKFSPKKSRVIVQMRTIVEDDKPFLAIEVIDNGKGIKPEFLPQIFDRFTQADVNTDRSRGGIGLGLAIVRDLMRLQNGSVRAISAGENKGSIFTLLLPRHD